ncbi:hypothetical protein [Paenibacillus qinlingensis]|uniref:Uncharacterized protein n=1 Tax=Paenibacillus qinlingensis TaxID=1837343 RepID=A0ABU1NTG7_9BACL|nr:hypothetical protein [Paenibacillus qinlingensis]MDR6550733.1 hypothetical protein [Paenibacillus qinlingensis]
MSDELKKFKYEVLTPNTGGSVNISLLFKVPVTLATVSVKGDATVWLTANVGWNVVTNGTTFDHVDVLFRIWRGDQLTGTTIYTAADSAQAYPDDHFAVTQLAHVDSPDDDDKIVYTLTGELLFNGQSSASVIGPITFTAAVID